MYGSVSFAVKRFAIGMKWMAIGLFMIPVCIEAINSITDKNCRQEVVAGNEKDIR